MTKMKNNTTPKKKSAAKKAAPKQRELKVTTESRINGLDVRLTEIEKLASNLTQRVNNVDASQLLTDEALDAHFDKVYQKTTELGRDITCVEDRLNKYIDDFEAKLKKERNDVWGSIKWLWLSFGIIALAEAVILYTIFSQL